jgi:hypothetical protein
MSNIEYRDGLLDQIASLVKTSDPEILEAMRGTSISANITMNQTSERENTPEEDFYQWVE